MLSGQCQGQRVSQDYICSPEKWKIALFQISTWELLTLGVIQFGVSAQDVQMKGINPEDKEHNQIFIQHHLCKTRCRWRCISPRSQSFEVIHKLCETKLLFINLSDIIFKLIWDHQVLNLYEILSSSEAFTT